MTPRMKSFLSQATDAAPEKGVKGIIILPSDSHIAGRAVSSGYGTIISSVVFLINEKGRTALDEETS